MTGLLYVCVQIYHICNVQLANFNIGNDAVLMRRGYTSITGNIRSLPRVRMLRNSKRDTTDLQKKKSNQKY